MLQQASLKQILFGEFVPPPAANIRRYSIMDETEPVVVRKDHSRRDNSSNKARLAAMTTATRNKVLETMQKFPGSSIDNVMTLTGLSRTTVGKHIRYLTEKKLVYFETESLKTMGGYVRKYYVLQES